MDPLLKWAGGKRWQVPLLTRIWYPYREHRLVEPFCGALSVVLGLEPVAGALLGDVNPHLINFYRQVQHGLKYELDLSPDDYYAYRAWFNDLIKAGQHETPVAAQLFWYLNRFGFNGLCRFNQDGEFNVPIGKATEAEPWSEHKARVYLSRYQFLCNDWRQTLGHVHAPTDFIYADPPYDDGFTNYSGAEFNWENQYQLAMHLATRACPVIITNKATDRILELYRDLNLHCLLLDAPRRIAASGDRTPAKEVLASNFPINPNVIIGLPS